MTQPPKQRMHDLALKGAGMQRPVSAGVHYKTSDTVAAIVQSIAGIDKDDADSWTKTKGPKVSALEAVLGYQITEAERDSAWQIFNQRG